MKFTSAFDSMMRVAQRYRYRDVTLPVRGKDDTSVKKYVFRHRQGHRIQVEYGPGTKALRPFTRWQHFDNKNRTTDSGHTSLKLGVHLATLPHGRRMHEAADFLIETVLGG